MFLLLLIGSVPSNDVEVVRVQELDVESSIHTLDPAPREHPSGETSTEHYIAAGVHGGLAAYHGVNAYKDLTEGNVIGAGVESVEAGVEIKDCYEHYQEGRELSEYENAPGGAAVYVWEPTYRDVTPQEDSSNNGRDGGSFERDVDYGGGFERW